MRLINRDPCLGSPTGGGAGFRSVDMAEQAVRHHGHFLGSRPCREDLQISVDLTGICIDDGAVGGLCQRQRERALAAGGRSSNKRDARAGFAL